jgi:hypothetical protein
MDLSLAELSLAPVLQTLGKRISGMNSVRWFGVMITWSSDQHEKATGYNKQFWSLFLFTSIPNRIPRIYLSSLISY